MGNFNLITNHRQQVLLRFGLVSIACILCLLISHQPGVSCRTISKRNSDEQTNLEDDSSRSALDSTTTTPTLNDNNNNDAELSSPAHNSDSPNSGDAPPPPPANPTESGDDNGGSRTGETKPEAAEGGERGGGAADETKENSRSSELESTRMPEMEPAGASRVGEDLGDDESGSSAAAAAAASSGAPDDNNDDDEGETRSGELGEKKDSDGGSSRSDDEASIETTEKPVIKEIKPPSDQDESRSGSPLDGDDSADEVGSHSRGKPATEGGSRSGLGDEDGGSAAAAAASSTDDDDDDEDGGEGSRADGDAIKEATDDDAKSQEAKAEPHKRSKRPKPVARPYFEQDKNITTSTTTAKPTTTTIKPTTTTTIKPTTTTTIKPTTTSVKPLVTTTPPTTRKPTTKKPTTKKPTGTIPPIAGCGVTIKPKCPCGDKEMKDSDRLVAVVITKKGAFKGRRINSKAFAALVNPNNSSLPTSVNSSIHEAENFVFPAGHYYFPHPIRFKQMLI